MPSTPKRDSVLCTVVGTPNKSSASKINNVTSSLTQQRSSISNLPPQVPPYRSVVIEKHTNFVDNEIVKTNTSKVKYAPPGQPATVLNTVINTLVN